VKRGARKLVGKFYETVKLSAENLRLFVIIVFRQTISYRISVNNLHNFRMFNFHTDRADRIQRKFTVIACNV
jgi:hypothetical protein